MATVEWPETFDAGVAACDPTSLFGAASSRLAQSGDAGSAVYFRLLDLLRAGQAEAIERCSDALDGNSALRGPFRYAAGLGRAVALDLKGAVGLLREGAWLSTLAGQSVFAADALFQRDVWPTMVHQANLCEPAEYPGAVPRAPWPVMRFGALPQGWRQPGTVVITSCCSDYFQAYAERFVASLRRSGSVAPVLIHIINPTRAARGQAITLSAADPGLLISSESGPRLAPYFASNRLVIAARLIERFERDLLVTDIDTVFPPGFPRLLDRAAEHELVLARNPNNLHPSMQISAAFVYLGVGPRTLWFLDAVEGYLARKLQESPIWMVDQAALFRAHCLLSAAHGPVTETSALDLPPELAAIPQCLVAPHLLGEYTRKSLRSLGACTGLEFEPVTLKPIYRYAAPSDRDHTP